MRPYESDAVPFLLIEDPLQDILGVINVSKPGSSYTLSGQLVILVREVKIRPGRLKMIGEFPWRVITVCRSRIMNDQAN